MSLITFYAFSLVSLQCTAIHNHQYFVKLLLSNDWKQRRDAYYYSKKHAEWSLRLSARTLLINTIERDHALPRKSNVSNDEAATCTPKCVALAILSEWQIPEAIPLLLKNLEHASDHFRNSDTTIVNNAKLSMTMLGLINFRQIVSRPVVMELLKLDQVYQRAHWTDTYQVHYRRLNDLVKVLYHAVGFREARRLLREEAQQMQLRDPYAFGVLKHAEELLRLYEMR